MKQLGPHIAIFTNAQRYEQIDCINIATFVKPTLRPDFCFRMKYIGKKYCNNNTELIEGPDKKLSDD